MRIPTDEQRLTALESDLEPLLIKSLKECANGRWGLFGQNQQPESTAALHWPEAEQLRKLAKEIREIRTKFGQPNAMCERRSEEHTSELQSQFHLVCRLLLEK